MRLFYDRRDNAYHERLGSQLLYWLDDLDAAPVDEADPTTEGFLFAGARPIEDYRELIRDHPLIRDKPAEREPLLRLDSVLRTLEQHGVCVPMPRTWMLPLDAALPTDLAFPLFVRTAESSWKKGGHLSRVRTVSELEDEAALLRRSLGWDAIILARRWLDLAIAGNGRHGPLPQEIRTWVVDGEPLAWSFHYMNIIERPKGFPPSAIDLAAFRRLAGDVASVFGSRLVVADFARGVDGRWWFIEAGPGSCAGTGHEAVFKAVARRLQGEEPELHGDALGGLL